MTEFQPLKERVFLKFLGTLKQDGPLFFFFCLFPVSRLMETETMTRMIATVYVFEV